MLAASLIAIAVVLFGLAGLVCLARPADPVSRRFAGYTVALAGSTPVFLAFLLESSSLLQLYRGRLTPEHAA
jgi:hypothetical protein